MTITANNIASEPETYISFVTYNQEPVVYVPEDLLSSLPEMIRNHVKRLSPRRQEEFSSEYLRRSKTRRNGLLALALFGSHYCYLRKWPLQLLFWLSFGGILVWWIMDIRRMHQLVNEYNNDVALGILKDIRVLQGR